MKALFQGRKHKYSRTLIADLCFYCKGQLISECLLGVIDFPKKQQKIWQISAPESKKRLDH